MGEMIEQTEEQAVEQTIAISLDDVSKVYKLYDKPSDRLKEALGLRRKKKTPLFKEHYALNNVNIQIFQGETVGIIGTNGSGKSTLLKIITGVLSKTGGNLTVNGRIQALLELGAGFNMEYTGIENIYLNGTMNGFSKTEIDGKLQNILDFADIGEFVYQPVKTYSSGMFVRLAFSVAINIDPEILIVDEALSVGDVFFQSKCYHKFEEFKKLGKTIIFVSHDLSSISKYCDRVVLLNQGKKLGEGTPKEMINVYKQVLVGQYKMPEEQEVTGDRSNSLLDDVDILEASSFEKKGIQDNPTLLEYGTKQAEIVEYYLSDEFGNQSNALLKGSEFHIHMTVDCYHSLPAPIFAFSIKDAKGTEITGTNTMFEKSFLEPVNAGDRITVVFSQKMSLQGGDYLLSLGLTGYEGSDFAVYHRLYDVLNISVISDKNTVGFYDMDSTIKIVNGKRNK